MKIGLALSGGVDSAVALYSLLKEGHQVTAYHIKTMPDEIYLEKRIKHKVCCSPSDTYDAKLIAKKFGVELKIIHMESFFRNTVISYFLSEHKKGRTPNPCYFCNRWIKFGKLFDMMLDDGMEMVSSGHYARAVDGKLYKAIDKQKDQSYFLSSIDRSKLSRLIFPNGYHTKEEVREIAKRIGIHVYNKRESQDLCFIPDSNQKSFLQENGVNLKPGLIVDKKGKILGKHEGINLYTIGQRKLGIATGEKMYVISKDSVNNVLIVGEKSSVLRRRFKISNLNFLVDYLPSVFKATVKVRKRVKEVECIVTILNNEAEVIAHESIFAVTPGQVATFYNNDLVIMSGIIDDS